MKKLLVFLVLVCSSTQVVAMEVQQPGKTEKMKQRGSSRKPLELDALDSSHRQQREQEKQKIFGAVKLFDPDTLQEYVSSSKRSPEMLLNLVDDDGKTPIHYVTSKSMLEYVLENGADPMRQAPDGSLALHAFCARGFLGPVRCWAEKPHKLSLKDVDNAGKNFLHAAAGSGNLELVQYLYKKNVPHDAQDKFGNTPLHCASTPEIADFLYAGTIGYFSKPSFVVNNQKDSPLHTALRRDHEQVAFMFLDKFKVDPNLQGQKNQTLLHVAAVQGNKTTIKELCARGARCSAVDSDGNMPLHVARSAEAVDALVDLGLFPEEENYAGRTPFGEACAKGGRNFEVIRAFVESGSKPGRTGTEYFDLLVQNYPKNEKRVFRLIKNWSIGKYSNFCDGCSRYVSNPEEQDVMEHLPCKHFVCSHCKGIANTYSNECCFSCTCKGLTNPALHHASQIILSDFLADFLNKVSGLDLNALNRDGDSPLHCAQSTESIDLLLGYGANINQINESLRTPIWHYLWQSRFDLANHLIDKFTMKKLCSEKDLWGIARDLIQFNNGKALGFIFSNGLHPLETNSEIGEKKSIQNYVFNFKQKLSPTIADALVGGGTDLLEVVKWNGVKMHLYKVFEQKFGPEVSTYRDIWDEMHKSDLCEVCELPVSRLQEGAWCPHGLCAGCRDLLGSLYTTLETASNNVCPKCQELHSHPSVHQAVKLNSQKALSYALSLNRQGLTQQDEYGCTPIFYAQDYDMIKQLDSIGGAADKSVCNNNGLPLPHAFVTEGHPVFAAHCLRLHGFDPETKDKFGRSLLHLLVRTKYQTAGVKLFCRLGVDPNVQIRDGKTALHIASDSRWVKDLVENGALLDICDADELSPLAYHLLLENEKQAEELLRLGASVNLPMSDLSKNRYSSILNFAQKYRKRFLEKNKVYFAKSRADEVQGVCSSCHLHVNSEKEYDLEDQECAHFICSWCKFVRKVSSSNMSACTTCFPPEINEESIFHKAVRASLLPAVNYFARRLRNINSKNLKTGQTALHLAQSEKMYKRLVGLGADQTVCDYQGIPPVGTLIKTGKLRMLTHLIEDGTVNLDYKTKNGETAMHHAIQSGEPEMLRSVMALAKPVSELERDCAWLVHYALDKKKLRLIDPLVGEGADLVGRDKKGRTAWRRIKKTGKLSNTEKMAILTRGSNLKQLQCAACTRDFLAYFEDDAQMRSDCLHMFCATCTLTYPGLTGINGCIGCAFEQGEYSLHQAVLANDFKKIAKVKDKEDLLQTDVCGNSLLHVACSKRLVDLLLDKNVSPTATNYRNQIPVNTLSSATKIELATYLEMKSGRIDLFFAARICHPRLAKMGIGLGLDPYAKDEQNKLPLDYLVEGSHGRGFAEFFALLVPDRKSLDRNEINESKNFVEIVKFFAAKEAGSDCGCGSGSANNNECPYINHASCPICMEAVESSKFDVASVACKHFICTDCKGVCKNTKGSSCPICRMAFD